MLGMIKRNIHFKSKDVIVRLYKALVRPKLEFCVQAWCLYLKKEIEIVVWAQKRATNLIEGYRHLKYSERLAQTGLITMEIRRVRDDLIQVLKILKGLDKLDYKKFLEIRTLREQEDITIK